MDKGKRLMMWLGIGLGIGFAAIAYWFITIPVIGALAAYYYFKSKPEKETKKEPQIYYTPPTKAEVMSKHKESDEEKKKEARKIYDKVIAEKRYDPRICEDCGNEIKYKTTTYCPFCGAKLS